MSLGRVVVELSSHIKCRIMQISEAWWMTFPSICINLHILSLMVNFIVNWQASMSAIKLNIIFSSWENSGARKEVCGEARSFRTMKSVCNVTTDYTVCIFRVWCTVTAGHYWWETVSKEKISKVKGPVSSHLLCWRVITGSSGSCYRWGPLYCRVGGYTGEVYLGSNHGNT